MVMGIIYIDFNISFAFVRIKKKGEGEEKETARDKHIYRI